MTVTRIDTSDPAWVDDPRLADYRIVRDPELVRGHGRFIAEGRMVVQVLLEQSPLEAVSVLVDDTAWDAVESWLAGHEDVPVLRVPSGALKELSGWQFHQGCLAVGVRPEPEDVGAALARAGGPGLVVALEQVSNPDNVGAIFRSAAALGAGAVVLGPTCASPLYRKAIRSSMGAALRLPFVHGQPFDEALAALREHGHTLLALTPAAGAEDLEAVAASLDPSEPRTLLLGAEGDGLSDEALATADRRVRIPMQAGMDSLNVAAAAAVAVYRVAMHAVDDR